MQTVEQGLDQRFKELHGRWSISLLVQLHEKKVERSFFGGKLNDIVAGVANRTGLEVFAGLLPSISVSRLTPWR